MTSYEEIFLTLIVMLAFSVLAFWKNNSIIFFLAAGTAMVVGFTWHDVAATTASLGVSLMIWAYSIVCLIFGFICIFKREPTD